MTNVIFPLAVPAMPACPTQSKCPDTDCLALLSFKMASHLVLTGRMIGNPISMTSFPSLYHVTCGVGLPMNTHFNSTSDPSEATTVGFGTSTFKGVIYSTRTRTIIINY